MAATYSHLTGQAPHNLIHGSFPSAPSVSGNVVLDGSQVERLGKQVD